VLLLAGCQTTAGGSGPAYTGSIGNSSVVSASDLTPDQALAAVQKWGGAYTRNEKDKAAALNYAAALRAAGETQQAVAVMRKAAIYHTTDREVLAAFGKALAADGQFKEALSTVQRAQRADNPDWQLLSTEGGILDSLGQSEEARARYRQALVLAPGEPQILNNLGLSLALTGELDEAEKVLQQAAASPKATLKTRENLALVLQLKAGGGSAKPAKPVPAPEASPTGPEVIQGSKPAEQNPWQELADAG
jgi:Flp pilus assembly protein TadD